MKRILLPVFCLAVLFGCTTEKTVEPVTEIGWFTPYTLAPDFITGQVKNLALTSFFVTEEEGEYVQGAHMTLKDRDSIGWSDDFIAYFDSMGLVTHSESLDDDGQVYGSWKVHSEDGKYMKAKWIKGDTARTYYKYSYDEMGNIVKGEFYRAGVDTLISYCDFTVDENGRWITAQWFTSTGEKDDLMSMEYNEDGRVIARDTKNPEGDTLTWWKYTLDENGLETGMEGMGRDSTMYTYEMKYLEFDEKGNWLKMVAYENGELVGMDVRTIEYY